MKVLQICTIIRTICSLSSQGNATLHLFPNLKDLQKMHGKSLYLSFSVVSLGTETVKSSAILVHCQPLQYLSCTRSGWLPYHWDFHIKTEEVQFGDIHWHSGLGWWWHEVSFWCWWDYHMAGRNVWPSLCAVWSPWPSSLQTNTQHSWYVHVNMLPVV